jgi:hypothetical protein
MFYDENNSFISSNDSKYTKIRRRILGLFAKPTQSIHLDVSVELNEYDLFKK